MNAQEQFEVLKVTQEKVIEPQLLQVLEVNTIVNNLCYINFKLSVHVAV